jgi:polysaccharide biosynthesis/export protein
MRSSRLRPLLFAAAVFSFAGLAAAQQQPPATTRPSPAGAAAALRNRPDLAAQLQQRLQASGMTPEQVRARLRAEGYPESMLDAYLPGGGGRQASDTTSPTTLLSAIESLGVVDSTDAAGLRRAFGDSLSGDSLSTDSLDAKRDTTRRSPDDSGRTVFGLNLFKGRTNQFEANLAGPVDANYRLGPGDRLVLILTGDVEEAYTLDVTREGFVVVPQVGQLHVANLTLGQFEDLLFTRLRRAYSGVGRGPGARTRFSVSVARLRTNQIFVVGDVDRPGSFRVSSAGTALTALYAAGGPTETGSLRQVLIRRGGRTVDTLDVYDYLLRGDASNDARLESGDVVFVPPHGPRVRVVGQVLRPATYEIRPGETLAQLVATAGGFQATAAQQQIQIERVLPPSARVAGGRDRVVVSVPLGPGGRVPEVGLEAGDVVRVFEVASRVRNRVAVLGNVWTPGRHGLSAGMRLSDALRSAGGVKPDTYLGEVLVTRLRGDSSRIQLRATLRDTSGAVVNDIPLQEDDEIRVFSVTEFRPVRYVAISGAVRKPGQFRYREGVTIRDLVLLAGGLDESALLNEAEIARLPDDRRNGVTARTFRVPLDSSYLFDRAPDGRYVGPPGIPAPRGPSPEVVLQPYDNVLVLRQPDFELQRTVFLGGEVRYPGRYALRQKTERVADLVARAGGVTTEANPEAVEFFRTRNRLGRVGIDLPAALRNARHRDNLILVDGDSIVVPTFNAVVTVAGAVNQPAALTYVPGRDIRYYIRAAGGGSRSADLSRAYVVQPSGKLESVQRRRLLPDDVPEPRPGARVVVPERSPDDRRDFGQLLAAFAQVAGTLTAIVAAVVALKNQ